MIGVVADDITGSNDIGIMFAKSNFIVDIYDYNDWESDITQSDVLILDTDSRFDNPETAYEKAYAATKKLKDAGAEIFLNKTCSVFRGNIGAEFDAMLDALGEEFAIVVLGFPKNGRTTIAGIHYVHGKMLEESEFKHDPMHPMSQSNLVNILQTQTKRKVGLIDYNVIKAGATELKLEIRKQKEKVNYLILDVTEQEDLRIIAEAVKEIKVIGGSSALAEELPAFLEKNKVVKDSIKLPENMTNKGFFCVAGSLMPQTISQIEYMEEKSVVIEMDTVSLLESSDPKNDVYSLTEKIIAYMELGLDVILHSSNKQKVVKETKLHGQMQGLNNTEVSKWVSNTLADITHSVIMKTGQTRFIVAGGDTSASVCRKMNIRGMRVWKEIQPGLSSCITLSHPSFLLVLKSGSFGKPNFFEKAFKHIKNQ
ncbi:four-carbon acid sugar kinase family protein [Bacillus sp. FJAT-49711]|uniref:four-carbon acid sugar kinase family protein n=1 Tax=Bacillus sp. FJAT-49711 TaxID=2833585 RepID=UPI001BC9A2B3|nr:four-carbon acid sugar kinase family protein [Bacillus sp. FJAT-49711]MBS4220897.1 four-carbon acid sugar kinase family protein [Bacillus sp. FJAT-49711]